MKRKETLYLAVTADKYELPVVVCDSAKELAYRYGIKTSSLYSAISYGLSGKYNGVKFVKVVV